MSRLVSILLGFALLATAARFDARFMSTPAPFQTEPPPTGDEDRVAAARARAEPNLRARFAAAGLAYPPAAVFLRGCKHERTLELWARPARDGERFRLVHTYPILAASGTPGPKRREGDRQVPEGFYVVDRFNPRSLYHLSLGLDYPNASDRLLTTDPTAPGTDIFIHGDARSIGCLAMGDVAIEEIFLAARDAVQQPVHVHLFPCRMDAAGWRDVLAPRAVGRPELAAFWLGLQAGFDGFEREKLPPAVSVEADGRYRFDSGALR